MRWWFAGIVLGFVLSSAAHSAERPNIVLILLDDVGFSDYGCYGGEIATPNFDRLARDGLRFTQFYNAAVCVTTRAALLTGLYPRYEGEQASVELTERMATLAEVLQDAGYRTSLSGKWHLGRQPPHHPLDRGFESYYGLLDGCSNHHDPSIRDPQFEGGRLRYWADGRERITKFPESFYSTDAITDHAIEQLRRFQASGRPFFVHVCYTAAHSPLHAKPDDIAKYRGRYRAGWDKLRRERFARQQQLGIFGPEFQLAVGEPEFPPWLDEPLQEWNAELMAVYAAMVDCADQNIGRLLQTLDDLGSAENTVVLVLNDNGGCASQAGGDDSTNIAGPKEHYVSCGAGWAHVQNTPLRRYKAWCHEGGIATPLIVRWPRVTPAGRMTHQAGHVIDLLPTLSEITGAKIPENRNSHDLMPVEGRSLVPALRNPEVSEPRRLFWAWEDNRAVRDGQWKLAWDQNGGRWELYDIVADRGESHDLVAEHPTKAQTLAAEWHAWAKQTGADRRLGRKVVLKP